MALLENVVVNWANIQKPNIQFEPAWEIQATLSETQAKELLAEAKKINPKGIKIKKEDNGTLTYRFRRKVERADGAGDNPKPVVVDRDGRTPFDKLVGNGSVCTIQYQFLGYDNKFGKGVTCDLKGVQVIEHVPFGIQDGEEFGSVDSEFNKPAASKQEMNEFDDSDFE